MTKTGLRGFLVLAAASAWPGGTLAQDAAKPTHLSLELNSVQPSEKGCRLTFVVTNGLSQDLTRAAFEIALFNEDGVVDRLTVLDFKDLPAGKTKVTRFDLAGTDCGNLSRALINGSTQCEGQGVDPAACMSRLATSCRANIAFGV